MLDGLEITAFPEDMIVREKERLYVKGLNGMMEDFYRSGKLPGALAASKKVRV
jgi:hypothetical protein